MTLQQYQLMESHLLVAMLRIRRAYYKTIQRSIDSGEQNPGEFSIAADNRCRCGDSPRAVKIESDYKQALREFHDFVLTKTIPQGFSSIKPETSRALKDSNWADANRRRAAAEGAIETLAREGLALEMVSTVAPNRPIVDRRAARVDRRSEKRVSADLSPARLSDAKGNSVRVEIVDVSSNGLGIRTNMPMPIGEPVIVEMTDGYRVFGRVKNCRATGPGEFFSAGIRISKIEIAGGCET